MENPGDSPQATRRRVWRFIFAALIFLAVVALWPLKGYSVDETSFGKALALPQLTFYRDERGGDERGDVENVRAMFMIDDFGSAREAVEGFEKIKESAVPGTVRPEEKIEGATVFRAEWVNTGAFAMGFRIRNIAGGIGALDFPEEPGETREQVVTECLAAILDGIDREIPGVTTFYNPPARQLWLDRVKPFLEEQFPRKPAP